MSVGNCSCHTQIRVCCVWFKAVRPRPLPVNSNNCWQGICYLADCFLPVRGDDCS